MKKNNSSVLYLILLTFPCIISTIILTYYNFIKGKCDMSPIVQILLSVVPTIGVIVVAIFHLRSGNKKIDEIGSDTKEIRPMTAFIEKYTEETNSCITREMKGNIERILNATNTELKELSDELKYQKRMREIYTNVSLRDNVVSSVDRLFEENAASTVKINELLQENERLNTLLNKYKQLYEHTLEEKNRLEVKRDNKTFSL